MRSESQLTRQSHLTGLLSPLAKDPELREWAQSYSSAERVQILIAGVVVDFYSRSPELRARLQEHYREHLAPNGSRAVAAVYGEPYANSTGLWEDEDPEFQVFDDRVVQRDFAAQRFSSSTLERAVAWLSPSVDDAFHNLLRWFLPPVLLRNGAFLLHGAGVIKDGKGYVFFGHSEAGKSTSVRLISEADPQALILGDDGIIIQMREDGPYVHAAPLGCGYSREAPPRECAPLAGLFVLNQAAEDRIEALSSSEAMTQLLASVMSVRFDDEAAARMELSYRFVSSKTGVRRLHFRKNSGFWPLVQKSI